DTTSLLVEAVVRLQNRIHSLTFSFVVHPVMTVVYSFLLKSLLANIWLYTYTHAYIHTRTNTHTYTFVQLSFSYYSFFQVVTISPLPLQFYYVVKNMVDRYTR